MHRRIKILGTGKYLPETRVSADEIDRRLGLTPGVVARKIGVLERRVIGPNDTASSMGAAAARKALEGAGLEATDMDAIVCAAAVPEQLIPCTASLVQSQLGLEESGIPCFDVNQTCLSWVTALDLLSYAIHAGRFERVLLIASEIASVGLDWEHLESSALFGDGAAAVVISRADESEPSKILNSCIRTYASGRDYCRIRGGGTKLYPTQFSEERRNDYLFYMEGPAVFRQALEVLPSFMEELMRGTNATLSDVGLFVPHQASRTALEAMRRYFKIPEERWMNIIADHGNCIAASIPMALHEGITSGRVQRGDLVAMVGTSAGFSVGGIILQY